MTAEAMPQGLFDELAAHYARSLADTAKAFAEENQEAVQTVVWLVGIATALLALMAASNAVAALLTSHRPVLISLLLGVVTFGVAQRVTFVIGSRFERQRWPKEARQVG